MVPRVTPWVLELIEGKSFTGQASVARTYIDLLCANYNTGIIEINEQKRIQWSGLVRAKTWRKRIDLLEKFHFVKVFDDNKRKYGYVVLIHPHIAVTILKATGKLDSDENQKWYEAYHVFQADCSDSELHRLERAARRYMKDNSIFPAEGHECPAER